MIMEQFLDQTRFTSSEKHLIEFIYQHPNVVVNLSIDDLSLQCHVSQASIVRFCKKLGVKGYSDFKILLAKELTDFALGKEKIPLDIPIAKDASLGEVADTFYTLSRQALESTRNDLNLLDISKAANMIFSSDIVHIYGRGESLILAEDFQYKLMRIGRHCHLEPLNGFSENMNRAPNQSKLRECALVISQYCNSTQVHYVIDELHLANIPFIILTAAKNIWPYDRYANIVLRIHCEESRNKMGCFSSRTAFLYVLDCLYGAIFEKNYSDNCDYLVRCAEQKATHDYYYTYLQDDLSENLD